MNRMPQGTWMGVAVVVLASAVACAPPTTVTMTDADARVVRDRVTVLENETLTAQALSRDAAYVVREGAYV